VSTSYKAYNNGSITFQSGFTTLIFCTNDKDSLYVAALLKADNYLYDAVKDVITLKDKSNNVVAVFTKYVPVVVPKPVSSGQKFPDNNDKYGMQTFYLPGSSTTVIIDYNSIKILGNCFDQTAFYAIASDYKSISIDKFTISNRTCTSDSDLNYSKAMNEAKQFFYYKTENYVELVNAKGEVVCKLTRVV
jgi:hypothetical protein